ncbi:hypothetical protein TPB0596_11910 [Tsukamurella pulmonis]|uniref:hypothetical protein n=1 Tax=Tsukamurella pulmonis TaxID=47312 RepID=UPI001EDF0825|nr:hypothetical protein [Tsukamurella pulmonis]BDD81428.1 hypothetical protein TPB0596_11910 [Tsukamurella pulmonis]
MSTVPTEHPDRPLLERLQARAATFDPAPGARSDATAARLATVVASWKAAA